MIATAAIGLVTTGEVLAFVATALSATGALAAAVFGVRASTRQSRDSRRTAVEVAAINATVERQRADQQAAGEQRKADLQQVQQLREWYERLIADQRTEIDRLHRDQERMQLTMDRLTDQLAREMDVSNALRNAIRAAQQQQDIMRERVAALEAQQGQWEGMRARIIMLETTLRDAGMPVPPP